MKSSANLLAKLGACSLILVMVYLSPLSLFSTSYAATVAAAVTPAQSAGSVSDAAPDQAQADLLERLSGSGPRIRRALIGVFAAVDDLPNIAKMMWAKLRADGVTSGAHLLGVFLAAFFLGVVVELFLRRAVRPVGEKAEPDSGGHWRARLGMLVLRAVIDLFAVTAFAGGSLAAMVVIDPQSELAHTLFMALLWLIVMIRMVAIISRAIFAPGSPSLRLFPIKDATALSLHWQVFGITVLILLLRLHFNLMKEFGLPVELRELVGIILSAAVMLALIGMILYWRESAAMMILGGRSSSDAAVSPLQRRFVGSCHVLAIAYVIGIWIFALGVRLATGESQFFHGMVSLLVLVAVPFADLGLRALAHRWFGPDSDEPATAVVTATSKQTPSYEAVALRNMRILFAIFVVVVLAQAWRIDLPGIVEGIFGARMAHVLIDVGVTLLLAYALWSVVETAVSRHVSPAPEGHPAGPLDPGGIGATRLQTLLPLLHKFLLVTLIIMVTMVALSSAGVQIGPLLAGAGMLGIAIGFGAQTLVRDIFSGIFFLVDDAFRMGEYVEVGDTRGTVEKISIRSMQLRHHNGPVHTVPFGEIKQITNYSRDWNVMKFELRLPFETDINRVRKIIKKIGQEMMADPELGPMMLDTLKSQGVNRMDDSALIIRCKVMCVPGHQFMVRREAYTRIQKAFEENGIHFAPRRVIVEAATPALAAQAAADDLQNEAEKEQKTPDDRG
ncbi:MAG: mechanosensitive ion channel [Gammaproteobacteria bacterium]|nr:mechanosensitive ion channel [Gammaproteobacteria bacterium]